VVDDTREDVEEFFETRGGDWPVVYSDNDSLSVAFGVAAVPETWVIDADGTVRVRYIGKVTAESLGVTLQQLREGGS
ncbi:MAG: TlpA disulfide reductase family protein, partial [Ilumatobacter sp.]|uniref:TlpA family protein disulfide reductase n=1 Tax=Ilumatobacter sp. TaxID=1967498 RepID=UPI003C70D307